MGGRKQNERLLAPGIENAKIFSLQAAHKIAPGGQHAHTDLHHLGSHLQRPLNISSSLLRDRGGRNHDEAENDSDRSAEEHRTLRVCFSKVAIQSERRGVLLATVTRAEK
jgi:hypothetical protein